MNSVEPVIKKMLEMGRLIKNATPTQAGLIPTHYVEALRFIQEAREPTMRELAEFLHITAPSTTSYVEVLSKDGLVVRVQDENDRRVVRIRLSEKGESSLHGALEIRVTALRSLVEKLSEQDQQELSRILSAIITNNSKN